MARTALTWRRLLGIDRSGGPPPATRKGQPLHPWTIPNVIGYIRLLLIPVFLGLALSTDDPRYTPATVVFAVIGGTDYLDGIAARVTGQYSRLGALIDPIVDRLLVVSGVIVCWKFELLPRWALAVLALREVLMLVLTRIAFKRGIELEVKMLGRWAVWPVMSALALAMLTDTVVSELLLYFGLALTLGATAQYIRDGWEHLRPSSSS